MRFWIFILVVALAGGYAWNRRALEEARRERDAAAETAKVEEAKLQKIQHDLERLEKHDEARDAAVANQATGLKAKISAKEAEIAALDAEIASRKNAGIDTAANGNLASNIEKEKRVLAEIDHDLGIAQAESKIVSSNDKDSREQSKAVWRAAHDDQNAQIQALSGTIAGENAQITGLRSRRFDYSAKQQATEIAKHVAEEKIQLEAMRISLRALDADWRGRNGQTEAGSNQDKAIAAQALIDLKERRRVEAAKLESYNRELSGVKKSEDGAQKNLSQLETGRGNKQRELDALRAQLHTLDIHE
jgi:hypothetical protein